MNRYQVLGTVNGYQTFNDYDDAKDCARENEQTGRKVEILETCLTPGRRYGSQWTVYKTVVAADGSIIAQ